jgi:acetyl-CoA carboxylase biotin carboxyl carrier protein
VDLTNDDVADILALLDSLPYDSLDLRTDKFRLTLRRAPAGGWTEESELLNQTTEVAAQVSRAAAAAAGRPDGSAGSDGVTRLGGTSGSGPSAGSAGSDGATSAGGASGADGLVAVVAPLPGTFFRAPRPGAPPFVEVGDTVGADTVIAIIETMKLMNSVHAGTPGRVARILLANGEFAPLDAPLLLIQPDTRAQIDDDS